MRLLFFLAAKALFRSRLSLVLLIVAVTAGVSFQIPNAANLEGYTEELLRQGLARATGHVLITGKSSAPLEKLGPLRQRLRTLPFVRGVTARLFHAGVVFASGRYQPSRVVGLDPRHEQATSGFCQRVGRGRCFAAGAAREAMLGDGLAQKLKLDVGARIQLVMPYQGAKGLAYARRSLTVVGILKNGGNFSADNDLFLPLAMLGRALERPDQATVIAIITDDHRKARAYARQLRPLVAGATVQAWTDANSFVANAIAGNRTVFLISMLMVVFAVGVPVLALLYIHVLGERKQIAVLAGLGFTRRALFSIYLLHAVLVGLLGVVLGLAIGLALCQLFTAYPIFDYDGFVVRPLLSWRSVLVPTSTVLGITLLAGLAPAWQAARANASLLLREP